MPDDMRHADQATLKRLAALRLPPELTTPADEPRAPSLWFSGTVWTERAIPPRPWIAPGYLLRQAVSVLVGPPSAGKSSLVLAFASALALGTSYGRFHPQRAHSVGILNVEDDVDEQHRRLSGLLRSMGKHPEDIAERLTLIGPHGVGTLLVPDHSTGALAPTNAMRELEFQIKDLGLDVLILDPFVELHTADENDNTSVRAVMAYFRDLAKKHDIAVVLLHHTRKGAMVAGDPDASRGASSIIGAARIVLTVAPMQGEEAAAFGIGEDQRRHYFRLDGAKSNYAPLEAAEWFERVGYELENGDRVAVAVPWAPPADVVSAETRLTIEAAISAGTSTGPYSPKLSKDERSIRTLFAANGVATIAGQTKLLADLIAVGYHSQKFTRANRAEAMGLRAPDGLPRAAWIDPSEE